MPRIIAGIARGRRITAPSGRTTRPTADRVREALFASIGSELGDLEGRRVLDLYSGSGSLGLEALSRGAEHVTLVESGRRAAATIRANIEAVGLSGARLLTDRVDRVLGRGNEGSPYDLVLLDPPYAVTDAEMVTVLELLRDHGWLAPGTLLVTERPHRNSQTRWPSGYVPGRVRRYGDAALWYGRAASPDGDM